MVSGVSEARDKHLRMLRICVPARAPEKESGHVFYGFQKLFTLSSLKFLSLIS